MSLPEVLLEQGARVAPILVTLAVLVLTRKIHDWLGVGVGANMALEVTRVAERVVRDTGANLKPELVESVGRGAFTKEVGEKLLASAVKGMQAALSKATLAAIEKNTPSVKEHLEQAIEAELAKQKASAQPVINMTRSEVRVVSP